MELKNIQNIRLLIYSFFKFSFSALQFAIIEPTTKDRIRKKRYEGSPMPNNVNNVGLITPATFLIKTDYKLWTSKIFALI